MRLLQLFLLIGFIACSRQSNQENNDNKPEALSLNFDQGIDQNLGDELWLKNLKSDTSNAGQNCLGVSIRGHIEASQESINALIKNGYNAFFFCWSVQYMDKVLYSTGAEYRNKIDKQFASSQFPFVGQQGRYEFNQHFPFANLGLPNGQHQIKIYLEVFPTRFSTENPDKQHKKLQFIGADALSSYSFNREIFSPQLYKGQVSIKQFDIDQTDKRKYDITLNGKGYPDPFWELETCNQIIYSSKPLKNTYQYTIASETPEFLVSRADTIKIAFYDFDQGPFNAKDLISEWKGTFEDLQKSKPSMVGSIRKLSLQSQFQKN